MNKLTKLRLFFYPRHRNYDGDGKETVKKTIGLMSKTKTLHVHHAFLYISLLCLHNNDVK